MYKSLLCLLILMPSIAWSQGCGTCSCSGGCPFGSFAAMIAGNQDVDSDEDCSFSTAGNQIKSDGNELTVSACASVDLNGSVFRLRLGSTIVVESGGYLVIDGNFTAANGSTVTVEAGGYLYITGDVNNGGPSAVGNFVIDGDMEVGGDFTNQSSGTITGSGTMQVSGSFVENNAGGNDFSGCGGGVDCCNGGSCTPLPVELYRFSGKLENNGIQLNWETLTEINNRGFYVEKSTDGKTFSNIGFVEGCGNSLGPKQYDYTDPEISSMAFYRLLQLDFDGKYKYYDPIIVRADQISSPFKVMPNPFVTRIDKIDLPPGNYTGTVHDLSGKKIGTTSWLPPIKLTEEINKTLTRFSTGTFIISVRSSENEVYVQRLVKKTN